MRLVTTRATRSRRDARARGESGQALLELALVVPILVLLIMAIFQFAYVIQSQLGLTNAVREAARRAAATTTDAPTWFGPGSFQEWVQKELCGDMTAPCGPNGLLAENVQAFDGSKVAGDLPAVSFCTYPAAGDVEYQVQVDVTYRHPLFFGLLVFATDAIDGTQNGFWDLSASAQMRLEGIDDEVTGFAGPGVTC